MPDFIAEWLNTNDIFNAMTMMEYWDGMVTTVQLVFLSLVIGLVVSTFQAATQINEQTLSFLPRLLVTLIVIIVLGPWLLTKSLDHAHRLISSIPFLIG